jgi:hypothetical protein
MFATNSLQVFSYWWDVDENSNIYYSDICFEKIWFNTQVAAVLSCLYNFHNVPKALAKQELGSIIKLSLLLIIVQSGRQQTSVGLLLRVVQLQAWATVGQAIAHATSGSHPNRDPPLLWNDQRRSWHTSVQLLTTPIDFCLESI